MLDDDDFLDDFLLETIDNIDSGWSKHLLIKFIRNHKHFNELHILAQSFF